MSIFSSFHLEKEGYLPATISNACPYADLIAISSTNPNRSCIYGHVTRNILQTDEFMAHSLWVKTTPECERVPFVYITHNNSIVLVNIPLNFDNQESSVVEDDVKSAHTSITLPFPLEKIFDGTIFFSIFLLVSVFVDSHYANHEIISFFSPSPFIFIIQFYRLPKSSIQQSVHPNLFMVFELDIGVNTITPIKAYSIVCLFTFF
jgi:hypothetical protein